ncbi:hypothetical protein GCM10007423_26970 [Dyadobacter endophyticus]|uniref:Uncharacterized protein n=1 Tax=Dyadobacter endophyticus TaxID=1749036 RepID=A0ABQ1YTC5_9BACT|nr:hypothetical protein GCM10007423_26970 [Dyadobacter endophyticus]
MAKKYGKMGLNAHRLKLSFYSNTISKAQTTGLADSSDYNDSHNFAIETRIGKEWSKTILSKRAKIIFGSDAVYKLYHDKAGVFTNSGAQKTNKNENVSAYGLSPFFGVTYGISKGLAISVETHLNLFRTTTRLEYPERSL